MIQKLLTISALGFAVACSGGKDVVADTPVDTQTPDGADGDTDTDTDTDADTAHTGPGTPSGG